MPLSLFDRLRAERNPWLIGLAVAVAAAAIVGVTAWYVLRESPPLFAGGSDAAAAGGATEGDAAADPAGGTAPEPAQPIYVHVAGAVVAPGVYKLVEGQRAVDAIAAAGGATADAAVDSINLAQSLTDGQRLYVPTRREIQGTPPGGVFSGGKPFAPPDGSGSGGSAGSSGGPRAVDLNSATKEELDGIPGIGPVLAERIILYRTVNGPFKSVDELTKVSGIGAKKLQDLKPYVTVR